MTFKEALEQLHSGKRVRRENWENKKHELKLGEPQVNVAYRATNAYDVKIPIVVANTELSAHITLEDIQSHDWIIVEETKSLEEAFLGGL